MDTESNVRWERYPLVAQSTTARAWLQVQANLGLAPNTIEAYGRALQDYLAFSARSGLDGGVEHASRPHIAAYVRDLTTRPSPRAANIVVLDSGAGLANATLQQRLTAVRLYYDYLIEEGVRVDHPVGRGRYTPGKGFGGQRDRGLIPRYRKLPWIPSEEEWRAILDATRHASSRTRLMLALAYDSALRREELCSLAVEDIDPAHRLIRIRAETTKGRQERVVPYSAATGELYAVYLRDRRAVSRARGALFLSESRRNRAQPITASTCSTAREVAVWRDALSGHSEEDTPPLAALFTTRPALREQGAAGSIWRSAVGDEGALIEQIGWGPESSAPPVLFDGLSGVKTADRRWQGALRRWAVQRATTESSRPRWQHAAALALATGAGEQVLLDWIARHPLLAASDLAELLREPAALVARRLEWLVRCRAVASVRRHQPMTTEGVTR